MDDLEILLTDFLKEKKKEKKQKESKDHLPTIFVKQLLADASLEFWHDPGDNSYCTYKTNNGWETWPVCSARFEAFLRERWIASFASIVPSATLANIQEELSARSLHAHLYDPQVRVNSFNDKIYLTMADPSWRVIEVDSEGWRLLAKAPFPTIKQSHAESYPTPLPGGSIDLLKKYFLYNMNEDTFKLVIGFILSCFRQTLEYPILVINGTQDSGKSTITNMILRIVDPCKSTAARPPTKESDLGVSAIHRHLLAYDNLSSLSPDMSDAICCLSTGYTANLRKLYTNGEIYTYTIHRPVILNGISALVHRDDLARRTIGIYLAANGGAKQPPELLEREFRTDLPYIFGALLDALSSSLKYESSVKLGLVEGLLSVANWVEASHLFPEGNFTHIYNKNREALSLMLLESDDLVRLILEMMKDKHHLYCTFDSFVADAVFYKKHQVSALKSSVSFFNRLERIKPGLARFKLNVVELGRDNVTGDRRFSIHKCV